MVLHPGSGVVAGGVEPSTSRSETATSAKVTLPELVTVMSHRTTWLVPTRKLCSAGVLVTSMAGSWRIGMS